MNKNLLVLLVLICFTMAARALKTALVTGNTDGIGLFTTRKLLSDGYRVFVHGRSEARVSKTIEELGGGGIKGFVHDLSTREGARALASDIEKECDDGLDLLINNAGVYEESFTTTKEGLELTFAVNVQAPFIITHALLPLLRKKEGARIINISSISQSDGPTFDIDNLQFQKGGFTSYASYGMSKRSMAMFSMELAKKITTEEALVVSIDPGTVNTKMLLAGWGRCGIEVEDATNEYHHSTCEWDVRRHGQYYVGTRPSVVSGDVKVEANRQALWSYLEELTGCKY
jgi:NAD(P)-dependent dehydrogenase (short-subunit alcohol dehydrogenase family)